MMGGLLSALIGQGVNLAGNEQAGQREARQLQLQQAINAAMMAHTFAKDEAQMGYERQRGQYYEHMAGQPDERVIPGVGLVRIASGGGSYTTEVPEAPKPDLAARLQGRVQQLVAQGMPLEKASTQARLEFGQQNQQPQTPTITVLPGTEGNPAQGVVTHGPGVGRTIPLPSVDKSAAGRGGTTSGIMLQTLARMGMSMNDLDRAVKEMDAYENNPANLQKLTVGKQMMGAAAEATPSPEAHGLLGALGNVGASAVGALGQAVLAKNDPAYRQYLYNKQRVATAFTELLPRPNQQLLGIEKGLSGLDVGWSQPLLADVQARRHAGLDMLHKVLASSPLGTQLQGGSPPSPSGVVTPAKPAKGAAPKSDYGIFGGP